MEDRYMKIGFWICRTALLIILAAMWSLTALNAQIPQDLRIEFIAGDAGPSQNQTFVTILADGSGKYNQSEDFQIIEHAEFTLNPQQLEDIWQSIQSYGFFGLNELYRNESLADRNYAALFVKTSTISHSVMVRNIEVNAFDAIAHIINGHLSEEHRIVYDMSPPDEIIPRDICDATDLGKLSLPRTIKPRRSETVQSLPLTSQTVITAHSGSVVGYTYSLQEAVNGGFVSLSGKGEFFGDGVRIDVDNLDPTQTEKNVITVKLYLEFYGSHATAQNVQRIKNAIEQRWQGSTSDGKQVVTEVVTRRNAGSNSPPGTHGYHQIKLIGSGRSFVNEITEVNNETGGGVWTTQGQNLDGMYAHEAGHLLGFDDGYTDYVKQADGTWKNNGQTLTSDELADLYIERNTADLTKEQFKQWADSMPVNTPHSIPSEGNKGDLMAELNGNLSSKYFDELAKKAGVIVEARPGDILVNKDGENQNFVNTRTADIFAGGGDIKTLEGLWIACIDAHKDIPSESDVFDIAPHLSQWVGIEAASYLHQLLNHIDAQELYCEWNFIAQYAIWRITDNQFPFFPEVDELLAEAGVSIHERFLDFPRLSTPVPGEPNSFLTIPAQLYVLKSPNVLAGPGTAMHLTGTLMAPSLEGLISDFSWNLVSKPVGSAVTLSSQEKVSGPTDDYPSTFLYIDPDVRGFYVFEVAATVTDQDQTVVASPSNKVALTAADAMTETFEGGALRGGTFYWQDGGQSPWEITSAYSHTGTYSARSGLINDEESSEMSVTIVVGEPGVVSFALRVSSEENYDYLRFYINGQMHGEWSGDVDWTYVSYTLQSGEYRLSWKYEKDNWLSDGFDRAWVDDIFFPEFTTGVLGDNPIPVAYKLEHNFPNPFNPATTIRFALPVPGNVNLKVYDILGREIASLIDNSFYPAGWHEIVFDASHIPSGNYFYKIEAGQFNQTRTMILLK
jgi:hypothetical protein